MSVQRFCGQRKYMLKTNRLMKFHSKISLFIHKAFILTTTSCKEAQLKIIDALKNAGSLRNNQGLIY